MRSLSGALRPRVSLLVIASLTVLQACGPDSSGPPIALDIYIDGSDRTPALLRRELALAFDANERLRSSDRVNIYLFGHDCQPLHSGGPFDSRHEFNLAVGSKLANGRDHLWTPGTHTELIFESARKHIGPSRAVELVISDGGMEDQGSRAMGRLSAAVASLGRNPDCAFVLLVGVDPAFREWWEDRLRPLGDRGAVRGWSDASEAIDQALGHARRRGLR